MTTLTPETMMQLQTAIDLVLMPQQTAQQMQSGEINYVQLREVVGRINTALTGDPTAGALSYEQVVAHIKDWAPKLVTMEASLGQVENRVVGVETTIDPILSRADASLKALQLQASETRTTLDAVLTQQQSKQEELIAQAKQKFDELEQTQQDTNAQHVQLVTHAQDKFRDMEVKQDNVIEAATVRFAEVEGLRAVFEAQVAEKSGS